MERWKERKRERGDRVETFKKGNNNQSGYHMVTKYLI